MDIEEEFELGPQDHTRAAQIGKLAVGDSVAVVRRVEIKYGFADGAIALHTRQIRGIADQQAHRARRQNPKRKYKVENGSFVTQDGSLILVASISRTD
jgi:hypothetical protein